MTEAKRCVQRSFGGQICKNIAKRSIPEIAGTKNVGDRCGNCISGIGNDHFSEIAYCVLHGFVLNARHHSLLQSTDGLVAEWLRRGLQILASRFDSGRGLHSLPEGFQLSETTKYFCPAWQRKFRSLSGCENLCPFSDPPPQTRLAFPVRYRVWTLPHPSTQACCRSPQGSFFEGRSGRSFDPSWFSFRSV